MYRITMVFFVLAGLMGVPVHADQNAECICYAADGSPDVVFERVTETIKKTLRDQGVSAKNRPSAESLYPMVAEHFDAYVAFDEMSRWVVGRHYWKSASQEERAAFTQAFKQLLISSYASTLVNVLDKDVHYEPLRPAMLCADATVVPCRKRTQIESYVQMNPQERLHLMYRVTFDEKTNRWQIYDIVVEGVSLMRGFQNQFSDMIRSDGLAKTTARIRRNLKEVS